MLGSTLTKFLSQRSHKVTESNRTGIPVQLGNQVIKFDILKDDLEDLIGLQNSFDYVLNCAGLIKHKIDEKKFSDVFAAFKVNSIFPHQLALCLGGRSKIIQIGTDCVFDGLEGNYRELSPRNAFDLYGVSKREGEVRSGNFMIIRSSVIGREIDSSTELLEWVLSSEFDTNLNGFVDHMWNGVTTLDFANIVGGIIEGDNFKSGIQHLIPRDQVSKFELLNLISQTFNRKDLKVIPVESGHQINRTLGTLDLEANNKLWLNGGYSEPPTIADMIKGYATWLKETQ